MSNSLATGTLSKNTFHFRTPCTLIRNTKFYVVKYSSTNPFLDDCIMYSTDREIDTILNSTTKYSRIDLLWGMRDFHFFFFSDMTIFYEFDPILMKYEVIS